jgi:L-asparaginase II
VEVLRSIQEKVGISEQDLLCGVHKPIHEPTAEALDRRDEAITPNRHNCSGKHTGMLAFARMLVGAGEVPDEQIPYIDPAHPIQKVIRKSIAEMCQVRIDDIAIGVDGCSVPNFALSLRAVAYGYARLCAPEKGDDMTKTRAAACRLITNSMISHPNMVGGPGRFDTRLMEVAGGCVVAKGGAEAYQGIGVMPASLSPDVLALGIAIKIADGDARRIVRSAVTLEVLRQLQILGASEMQTLSEFGPSKPLYNWRKIVTGQAQPSFILNWTEAGKRWQNGYIQ